MERQGKLGTLRKRGMIARKIIKDGVTQQNKKSMKNLIEFGNTLQWRLAAWQNQTCNSKINWLHSTRCKSSLKDIFEKNYNKICLEISWIY